MLDETKTSRLENLGNHYFCKRSLIAIAAYDFDFVIQKRLSTLSVNIFSFRIWEYLNPKVKEFGALPMKGARKRTKTPHKSFVTNITAYKR